MNGNSYIKAAFVCGKCGDDVNSYVWLGDLNDMLCEDCYIKLIHFRFDRAAENEKEDGGLQWWRERK